MSYCPNSIQFNSKSFIFKVFNLFCCGVWRAADMLSIYDVRVILTNKIQTHSADQWQHLTWLKNWSSFDTTICYIFCQLWILFWTKFSGILTLGVLKVVTWFKDSNAMLGSTIHGLSSVCRPHLWSGSIWDMSLVCY